MSNLTCGTCVCKCLLYPLSCLYGGDTMLNASLESERVKKFMDTAQLTYIMPLLGDCFKQLCTALENSRKKSTEDGYEALADKWSNFLDKAEPLVSLSTEYVYITRIGYGVLKRTGLVFTDADREKYNDLVKSRRYEIQAMQALLLDWLVENEADYDCLPTKVTSCIEDSDTSYELDNPLGNIDVV